MLFLGTEKYPLPNEYSEFISKNSGSTNAYTSALETNYHFDCKNEALPEGLDRFSQFFIKPLFTEEFTNKELNAVHSEHQKNLLSDVWRERHLFKSTTTPGSVFSKFSTGNNDTLKHDSIHSDMR